MKKNNEKEKKERVYISGIFARYLILVAVAIPNFYIFYLVFTPFTIYPSYFLLNFIYGVSLIDRTIFVNGLSIELINACIAGSAYYLLAILNLSVPNIKIKKRANMLAFAFIVFLIVNVLRILFLSVIYIEGFKFFDIIHKIIWYLGSTILVVGIWFAEVKLFKIAEIPVYSDLKYFYKKSSLAKLKILRGK